MKVTIDTDRKVIEIDSTIKLVDLIDELKELLGKDWKEYSIEQKYNWTYWPSYPTYPITYTDNIDYTSSSDAYLYQRSEPSCIVDIIRN